MVLTTSIVVLMIGALSTFETFCQFLPDRTAQKTKILHDRRLKTLKSHQAFVSVLFIYLFVVYLTMLFGKSAVYRRIKWSYVNDELRRIWKEGVVA
jgi:uncharacterized membrane protein YqhA